MVKAIIIDDNIPDRKMLSLLLAERPEIQSVETFESGFEAMTYLLQLQSNLDTTWIAVLCDRRIAGEDGTHVLEAMAQRLPYLNMTRILMNGMFWEDHLQQSHPSIDYLLEKKIDPDHFAWEIEKIILMVKQELIESGIPLCVA